MSRQRQVNTARACTFSLNGPEEQVNGKTASPSTTDDESRPVESRICEESRRVALSILESRRDYYRSEYPPPPPSAPLCPPPSLFGPLRGESRNRPPVSLVVSPMRARASDGGKRRGSGREGGREGITRRRVIIVLLFVFISDRRGDVTKLAGVGAARSETAAESYRKLCSQWPSL